jgi:hypothetical protein
VHTERCVFRKGLSCFAELGLREAELFGPGLERLAGAERLPAAHGGLRLRFPLPDGARGPLGGGWALVERWSGAGLGEALAARFTAPRSASIAERRWNLLCACLAHGLGVPEPLALAARAAPGRWARESLLVTRDLRPAAAPLAAWLALAASEERARGLAALAAALGRLARSGLCLPRLSARSLYLDLPAPEPGQPGARPGDCGAPGPADLPGRPNRLPGVHLADVARGRQRARSSARERAALAARLSAELAPHLRAEELAALVAALCAPAPPSAGGTACAQPAGPAQSAGG